MKNLFRILVTSTLLTLSVSCERKIDTIDPHTEPKRYITEAMKDLYFWYDKMPEEVDSKGKDLFEHFEMLLYSEDKWSWMMDKEKYLEVETGVYRSWGGVIRQPIDYFGDYEIKMALVHPFSPFGERGVKRGWTLTHIGGKDVQTLIDNSGSSKFYQAYDTSPNSFTFRDFNNVSHTFEMTSRAINTRSSLFYTVFTNEDFPGLTSPVGYFNYLTFNKNMLSDIDEAIEYFNTIEIKELIIDLRYNGGGDATAMEYLADHIAPEIANNEVLARRKHSDKLSVWDDQLASIINNRPGKSLSLDRIFFITNTGTASASEILINGLIPFMEVIQVGRATYGKFNGMYILPFPENEYVSPEYVFLPVSFFTVNKDGQGEYEAGLVPDSNRPDDLYHDFGVEEDNIRACLTYIATGRFPSLPARSSTKTFTGYRIKTEIDEPEYGLFIDRETE